MERKERAKVRVPFLSFLFSFCLFAAFAKNVAQRGAVRENTVRSARNSSSDAADEKVSLKKHRGHEATASSAEDNCRR